jgi:DNA polymerase III epsilon subunit-like protein
MTYTLVFDTETTGLPPRGIQPLEVQPWIIQIAAILYRDRDRVPSAHFSTFLLPEDGELRGVQPTDKFFVENKLTAEWTTPSALPLRTGFAVFNQLLQRADRVVAHNMAFDCGRMRDNYRRLLGELYSPFEQTPRFCTMETLTPVMKLPGRFPGKYKWPNLAEAYKELVNPAGFSDAHDAMNDVQACAAVLHAIEDRSIPLFACN